MTMPNPTRSIRTVKKMIATRERPVGIRAGIYTAPRLRRRARLWRNAIWGARYPAVMLIAPSRESRHDLAAVAPRITAPPTSAIGPGVSRWTSHAPSGDNHGPDNKNSDTKCAVISQIALDRK